MTMKRFGRLLIFSILGLCAAGADLRAQTSLPTVPPIGDAFSTSYDGIRNERFAELYKLEQKAQAIAAELRAKPDSEKEALLKKLVEDSFEKRHAMQVAEAKALAEKLAKVQETMRKREEKKTEIIARRVKQLLGEPDDLDWNLTPPRGNYPQPVAVPSSAPYPPVIPVPNPPSGPRDPSFVPLTQPKAADVTKPAETDVQILQIELARAELNLKEAQSTLDRVSSLEKSGAISTEDIAKSRFAAEARRLEVDLARRRLQIAVDRQKKQSDSVPQVK